MHPGTRVGQFELLEVIGRGGMGEVWRAHDTRLERDVALKTLPARFAGDATAIARLTREARLLAALNHPNIAAILGIEEQDGSCWLVLELVEGATLEQRLAAGSLALRDATDIAMQVADALQAAHSRGIIHCDLKPSNIKLSAEGRVKVLDFGIARSLQAAPQAREITLTAPPATGEIAGTPLYMSPEQMRGEQVGPTSDIWAFGVLLYRMLSARVPFAGPTSADVVAQVLQSEPDLSLLRPQVPEAMVRLVRRCLEKEPRRRIQHAGDLRVLIEEALHVEPASASAATTSLTSMSAAPRRPWLAIAILGAAAVIGVGAWKFHGRNRSPAPAVVQPAATDASIAVLPFVNMSADPEQEYFSDGLSEELINQLAHNEGLRVTARTSAFSFKGKAQDLRTVGKELGVSHILEGSVRRSGDRLRITAQLINVATGYHVWSETFDRAMDDVFSIQDEIAAAVAGKLGPSLGVGPGVADYGGTRSLEAYDHLLRGASEFNKFSPETLRAAVNEYRAALVNDPSYARASAELAMALSASGPGSTDVATFKHDIEAAVDAAVRNAPDAPLTHVAQMWMYADRHDWIAADAACLAALAGGNDPRAKGICAGFLTLTGRVRAALPYREAARQADPLSISNTAVVVRQYAILEMGPELRREYSRVDGLTGARWQADESMLAYLAHGGASREEMLAVLAHACPAPKPNACDAWGVALRTPQQARAQLRSQFQAIKDTAPAAAGSMALAAAYAGDKSLALDALEILTSRASSPSFQYLWFPLLADVRKEARFKRIVRELGFVDLWQRTGRWADFCHPTAPDDFECS